MDPCVARAAAGARLSGTAGCRRPSVGPGERGQPVRGLREPRQHPPSSSPIPHAEAGGRTRSPRPSGAGVRTRPCPRPVPAAPSPLGPWTTWLLRRNGRRWDTEQSREQVLVRVSRWWSFGVEARSRLAGQAQGVRGCARCGQSSSVSHPRPGSPHGMWFPAPGAEDRPVPNPDKAASQ